MPDITIHPSTKIIMLMYLFALVLTLGGLYAANLFFPDNPNWWFGGVLGILYLFYAVVRHLGLMREKFIVSTDRLRHESGFISKDTRTIDLAKVQDVSVHQNVKQRLLGMGRLSVETAGGSSSIVIDNVDSPHKLADMILERSRQSPHHLP